jgi:iron complex outermembrane receptor protein
MISITASDVSLRSAIDRVAAESNVQLSYSADLLPADKRICLDIERMSSGAVLTELLRGTSLRAIVLDANNVALTPVHQPAASERTPVRLSGVGQLNRVVVTGSAAGAKRRTSPYALDVVEGSTMARNDASTLSSAFDGVVPGMWMWTQAPSNLVGRFGSVRGASSFGVTSPKMYIDGIEVANPLVFTQFDPERIDRVEVIRGPQGAALYGADAISGVVNIITRHDGAPDGQPSLVLRSRAGISTSAFSSSDAFVQDHSIEFRAGDNRRSFGLGLNGGTVGNYIPGGSARSLLADGNARLVGSKTVLTGMARLAAKQAGTLTNPVLSGLGASAAPGLTPMSSSGTWANQTYASQPSGSVFGAQSLLADSLQRMRAASGTNPGTTQSLMQYTLGTTGTWSASSRWTHTLVAGVDGYRLNGALSDNPSVPVYSDTLDRLTHSAADRTTLALRSTARVGSAEGIATSFIVGAEHTATREEIESHGHLEGDELFPLSANSVAQTLSFWSNTAGLLTQVNSSWRNSLFLSAGGRAEYSSGAMTASRVNLLPMLGAAYVREHDGQTLKLRAAYGKGIRPSNSMARAATWMSGQTARTLGGTGSHLALESLRNLEPEVQAGIELGADVLLGAGFGIHITRFNQRATGLIQAVALPTVRRVAGATVDHGVNYELQNVGAITNRGWELQATSSVGRFAFQSSASFVDSRVQQVATGYSGELRPGDRMLEVPRETLGLTASYTASRWTTSWSLTRAMHWISYDQLRIAEQQSVEAFDPKTITGAYLRNYWREYDGANRLRATLSCSLRRGLSLVMTGDNLLNLQRGEPDNITVIPGRTLTAGLRTRF